ncbi:hypothetical protein HOB87_14970, partial [Candidatus Woesearchaeota archaeon]|nr:hypothetical protein [Candidatus Woesearchaeota archaeon]
DQEINFSQYNNVFCDSLEALEWAYKQGLSRNTLIRTSSPAMLWHKNMNIQHVEERWSTHEMKIFQTTIQGFSENVYDQVMSINGTTHEESLCIAQTAVSFHKLLFKAACLTEADLIEPRLFIRLDGKGGPGGNNMNTPWDKLLINNSKFKTINYTLKNDKWDTLTTAGVSLWNRIYIGGIETLIYRLLIKLMDKFPINLFNKQIIMPNENELIIETSTALALNRTQIRRIRPNKIKTISTDMTKLLSIRRNIRPFIRQRISDWVMTTLVSQCEEMFFNYIEDKLNSFLKFRTQWQYLSSESKKPKKVLLINAAGNNANGLAISSICREAGIPVVSTQHGVTAEICATHGEGSSGYEINVSDFFFVFNEQSKKITESSHFSTGKATVVGIPARHLRMRDVSFFKSKNKFSIVYVSTNLYRGNLGGFYGCQTDYGRSINEKLLITNVFGRLSHKVLYKTYPEDNRRYADEDPVNGKVRAQKNMVLFNHKVDMRYLLGRHRVLITSGATSTVSWLIMSGKPVVFINWHGDHPLSKDAHASFSRGLFLFDDSDHNFHKKLYNFLSLPIGEIERLWKQKKNDRKNMINQFFTSSTDKSSGKMSARIIQNSFFDS